MATTPLVTLRGVQQHFGRDAVLEDVDLDVLSGQVLGLIGPNGGGKSTLLYLLAGLTRPTSGTVTLEGVPTSRLARTQAGVIGLVTAHPGLYPLLTGWENLVFFAGLFGRDPHTARRLGGPMLQELGLLPAMDRPTGTWSSGMQQKLSLVRASLLSPRLLLLDEPTANLDPLSAQAIWHFLRQRADEGLAVVVVTHDLTAAEALCDRVAVVQRTLGAVESLEGPRAPPPTGRLFDLYARMGSAP